VLERPPPLSQPREAALAQAPDGTEQGVAGTDVNIELFDDLIRADQVILRASASRLAYLMIHQLEIGGHDYGADASPLSRVAQFRRVHRLDRREHQSHARAWVPSRCPVHRLDS
jgi:hypothetical protein